MEITHIVKRDFSVEGFNLDKITAAIFKSMQAVGRGSEESAQDVALMVYKDLLEHKKQFNEYRPTIEQVQDIVETSLMKSNFPEVAKAYILYRNEQAKKGKQIFLKKELTLNHMSIPNYTNMFLRYVTHIGFIPSLISQVTSKILNLDFLK